MPLKKFIFGKIADLQPATKIFKPLEVLFKDFYAHFNTACLYTLMSGDNKTSDILKQTLDVLVAG